MVHRKALVMAALLACLGIGQAAAGVQNAASVQRAKLATAYAQSSSGKSATAFCIDSTGYFVTDNAIGSMRGDDPIQLVLNPAEPNQTIVDAVVVATDSTSRLNILKANAPGPFTALNLGDTRALIETNVVTALGYPFGRGLAATAKEYPAVTVSVGRITSLRRQKDALSQIQLDTSLNPGNSGGPVLNDRGDVVGIVEGGLPGAALSFAIPVEKLRTLIARPAFVFLPPVSLTFRNSVVPIDWTVEVWAMPPPENGPPYSVELTLPGIKGPRKFVLKADGPNRYAVSAPAVEPVVEAARVRVSATFVDGTISGQFLDREARVAGATVMLSEISEADRDGVGTVTLTNGTVIRGALDGPSPAQLDINGKLVTVDLAAARSIVVSAPTREPDRQPVQYGLGIRKGENYIMNRTGTILLTRDAAPPPLRPAPAAAAVADAGQSPRISAPPMSADRITAPLPAQVDDVVLGRGGRYLLLQLKHLRYVAIFDISVAKITAYIPVTSDAVKIAAGLEKLFVLRPDTREIERWNLLTLQKEQTIKLDVNAYGLAMGYASNGPLMVITSREPTFFDADTLSRLPVQIVPAPGQEFSLPWLAEQSVTQASADGAAFATRMATDSNSVSALTATGKSSVSVQGNGGRLLRLGGNAGTEYYFPGTKGPLLPSFDASMILTGAGVFSSVLKPLAPQLGELQCVPSTSPAFFVCAIEEPSGLPGRAIGQPGVVLRLDVYESGARRRITSIADVAELTIPASQVSPVRPNPVVLEKRVFLIPQANLLVTLPASLDQLVLRRFDIVAEVRKSDVDYLFVASVPPRVVNAGEPFQYAIDVKSKSGGVRYRLESGPFDLNLDAAGVLSWKAPARADAPVFVDIAISDATGQEIHHTFVMTVK